MTGITALSMVMLALGQDGETFQQGTAPGGSQKAPVSIFVRKSEFQPLTGGERWRLYFKRTYLSPGSLFRAAGPALGGQMNNEPPEWGQGAEGYMKRFGNRYARFAIRDSINSASAAALGYDVRYVKCECKGVLRRTGHALAMNFVTLNRNGNYVFNAPLVGSAFAAEFIGNTWMPKGYRTTSEAMRGIGVQIGIGGLFNIVREFVPARK